MNTLANKNGFRKTKFANSSSQTNERTNERTNVRSYVRTKCITKTLKYIFEKCTFFSSFQEMMDLKGMKRQNACFYHDKIFFKCLFEERIKKTRRERESNKNARFMYVLYSISYLEHHRNEHFISIKCVSETQSER